MRTINFVKREGGPERLVAEAEVLLDDSDMEGLKLVGFSLWRDGETGEVYVTFPARPLVSKGRERKYYDFLRSNDPQEKGPVFRLKAVIVDAYYEQHPGERRPARRRD